MTKLKWLMFLIMAVVLASMPLLGAACSKEQGEKETITLKFATFVPDTGKYNYDNLFMDEVTKRTGNQVQFQKYWTGTLAGPKDLLDAAKNGLCDIADVASPYVTPRNETMLSVILPEVFTDLTVATKTLNEFCRSPIPDAEAAAEGVIYLHVVLFDVGMATKVPLNTLADFKGLRLHTSGLQAAVQQALGVNVVTLTAADVATGLDRGTIDGVAGFPVASMYAMGIAPYIKYTTDVGLGVTGYHTVMNRGVYNDLPADVRKIIDDVEKEMPEIWTAALAEQTAQVSGALKAQGVQVVKASDSLISQVYAKAAPVVAKGFIDDLNKYGKPGTDLWNSIISIRDKYMKAAGLPIQATIQY